MQQGGVGQRTANWRLSRIDEHMEKLHFSTTANHGTRSPVFLPGAKAGTLPRRSPQQQTAWDNDLYSLTDTSIGHLSYNNSSSTPNLDNTDDIYSKAVLKPAYSGDKILDSKHAVKVITGKYDSLGRMKNLPPPEPLPPQPIANVLPPSPFGSAEFPPPPPEGYAPVPDYSPPEPHVTGQYDVQTPPTSPPQGASYRGPPVKQVVEDFSMCPYQDDCHRHVPTLTEQEILQIEMFYRSHKTEVFVCQSLANLYFGTIRGSGTQIMSPCRIESSQWQFFKSGIPVLVLDSGHSRRKRKLHIGLAERGTGFSLWKDAMNHLTSYASPQSTFHTMHLSNDHTKLAGFRFVDATAAVDFYHKIFKLISDPNDDILNLSGKKGNKKAKPKDKKKYKAPTKADISTPCCFTHITKLDRADGVTTMLGSVPSQKSLPSSPTRPMPPSNMTSSYS